MTQMDLLPEIFKLHPREQLMIAEAIRNHLVGGLAPQNEAEFKRELEDRLKDAELHPDHESPLDETMARLRAHK